MLKSLILASLIASSHPALQSKEPKGVQVAVLCFKSGEELSGANKICYYDCLGSRAAITISAVALCPLSIDH